MYHTHFHFLPYFYDRKKLTLWNVLVPSCTTVVCSIDISPVPVQRKGAQIHVLMWAGLHAKIYHSNIKLYPL